MQSAALRAVALGLAAVFGLCHSLSAAGEEPVNGGANAAGAAASAPQQLASAPDAASAPIAAASAASAPPTASAGSAKAEECPPKEAVLKRVIAAANWNALEESAAGGGAISQVGEVVSNLTGFGALFQVADTGAGLSAGKKLGDAIAADPCGQIALDSLPGPTRVMYQRYVDSVKKK
jgi:hypothetical protein